MPTLLNPGHECYARARARGAKRVDAYKEAGYVPYSTSAGRVERRPEVTARIAELRLRDLDNAAPGAIMARLLRLADACEALGAVPALREGRLALLEALRLQVELTQRREEEEEGEKDHRPPLPPELTEEQWIFRYGRPEDKQRILTDEWSYESDRHGWRADDPAAAFSKNGS